MHVAGLPTPEYAVYPLNLQSLNANTQHETLF